MYYKTIYQFHDRRISCISRRYVIANIQGTDSVRFNDSHPNIKYKLPILYISVQIRFSTNHMLNLAAFWNEKTLDSSVDPA